MRLEELENTELFRMISEGKERAFKIIFNRYKDRFYGVALKMTRSSFIAEEVVQDTFVSLWNYRSSLGNVEFPGTYLYKIVQNKIAFQFKKIARERAVASALSLDGEVKGERTTDLMLQEKETRELYEKVVSSLPEKQRLVFELSQREGLSRNEIAEKLRISPNTVKNHLLKAQKYLRSKMLPHK